MQYGRKPGFQAVKSSGIFCCALLLFSIGVKAESIEYDLRVLGKKNTVIQVYEVKTSHLVWTRPYFVQDTYPDTGTFFWSRDRRAVAFVIESDDKRKFPADYEGYEIVVWRAGRQIHVIAHQPITNHDSITGHDYVEDMVWSADGKSLLVWVGGSGESMANMGHLFCFNVVNQKIYFLGDAIGKPLWIGSQTAKFWQVEYKDKGGMIQARKPSFWHLPKPRKRCLSAI